MDGSRLRALLDAGRSLVAELDSEVVLQRLLDVARQVTGAQYAAIGVLDEAREGLEQFLVAGIDPDTQRRVGDLPHGRGVLGVLISEPRPLRLDDVGQHPLSYGFPAGHPPMTTFLGVPILIEGEPWGNLYLTEKAEPFTQDDEDAVVVLAEWAAVAITNARLYRAERAQRAALERSTAALATTAEVARALGGVTDVDRALELIVKRSRALVGARLAEIALLDDGHVTVAAIAGEGCQGLRGERMPVAESLASHVARSGRAMRFDELPEGTFARRRIGAQRAMAAPMVFRSEVVGFLMVFDRYVGNDPFTADDERLLVAFAAAAATAVATAQQATMESLRRSMAASEAERTRWARELHDETLQELAGLRVLLSAARRSDDTKRWRAAMDDAVELIGGAVQNLRVLITDLRPASLDQLGLGAALEALGQRSRDRHGVAVDLTVDLGHEAGRASERLKADVEAGVYRLVQEALTNIHKHAKVDRAHVSVREEGDAIVVEVCDDGVGFDEDAAEAGFGLIGMRERANMLGGELTIQSRPGTGTTVIARLPSHRHAPALARTAGVA